MILEDSIRRNIRPEVSVTSAILTRTILSLILGLCTPVLIEVSAINFAPFCFESERSYNNQQLKTCNKAAVCLQ